MLLILPTPLLPLGIHMFGLTDTFKIDNQQRPTLHTVNAAQYYVIISMEKEFEKEEIHVKNNKRRPRKKIIKENKIHSRVVIKKKQTRNTSSFQVLLRCSGGNLLGTLC